MSLEGSRREEGWALAALAAVMVITVAWWALALWPANAAAPDWLVRTQRVCFGVRANGLPDAAGWTGLIASPLGMFALLFASARRPFARVLRRLPASWPLRIYVATLGALTLTGAASAAVRVRSASSGDVVQTVNTPAPGLIGRAAPPLRLIDQHGDTIDLATLRGREVLVTFAYAHCETVCPAIVHNALQLASGRRASGRVLELLIVTLDPARDTPARLPTIAREWQIGSSAHVLSGDAAAVNRVLDAWQIARAVDPQNGAIAHTAVLYQVDASGMVRAVGT